MDLTLFDAFEAEITPGMVRGFVRQLAEERLFTESLTVELKSQRTKNNVAEAVCAFANSSGGLVLLGIDEKDPTGAPGVGRYEATGLVNNLRAVLDPPIIPLVVAVAAADAADRVVIVIRVDPQPADVPVMIQGRTYIRVPGASVVASQQQVLDLLHRQGSTSTSYVQDTIPSAYAPPYDTGGDSSLDLPDLRLRAAHDQP